MLSSEEFLHECGYARVVDTPNGQGILIGGIVFNVLAPPADHTHSGLDYTSLLARALRCNSATARDNTSPRITISAV